MRPLFRLRALCVIAAAGYSAGLAKQVKEIGIEALLMPAAMMVMLCLVPLAGIWCLNRVARWLFPLALMIQGALTFGDHFGVPQAVPVAAVGFVAAIVLQAVLLMPSTKKLFFPQERDPDAPVL